MSRRPPRVERLEYGPPPPSKCAKFLYYTWKLCSVVFSHFVMISLVVAYCILGAVTFERLEAQHEREVKMNISQIRGNTTHSIWLMTNRVSYLNQADWTADVVDMLKDFENAILLEMKVRGWDGNESTDHIQWTFTGALFYSIIVITTIGYGHIAPKTQSGKVVTIFYAILGIPLMLLCLSNIGDVMASSFRFLYWRVCCYVCTRPPKEHHRYNSRRAGRSSTRRRQPRRPLERSHSDTDCRYRDSGYLSTRLPRAPRVAQHSPPPAPRARTQPPHYTRPQFGPGDWDDEESGPDLARRNRHFYEEREEFPKISLPLQDLQSALKDLDNYRKHSSEPEARSKSLPRPPLRSSDSQRQFEVEKDGLYEMHDLHDVDYENYRERKALEERRRRRADRGGSGYRDHAHEPDSDDATRNDRRFGRGRSEYYERDLDEYPSERRRGRRARSAFYEYERHASGAGWGGRAVSPGRWAEDERRAPGASWAGRAASPGRWAENECGRRRLRRLYTQDDSRPHRYYSPSPERDEWSDEAPPIRRARSSAWGSGQSDLYPASAKDEIKPVPIWLCVLLVASYIVAGTFLFKRWEGWAYLDAAYFCFITLTTIGFGDFVPAQGQSGAAWAGEAAGGAGGAAAADAVHSIALCSLYLLFGIALLAMSFNLVQEEVRANVAALATRLGIIKPRDSAALHEPY